MPGSQRDHPRMAGYRHSANEIKIKLGQGIALTAQGKTQAEICRLLGISVMTYHRWRKTVTEGTDSAREIRRDGATPRRGETMVSENQRLRRVIVELLLANMRLREKIAHLQITPGDTDTPR
jgi:putative transposase